MQVQASQTRAANRANLQRHAGERPTYRLSNPAARITLGALASAALFGATALLFGPVSDERAIAMAGTPHGAPFQYAGVVDQGGRAAGAAKVAVAEPRPHGRAGHDGDVMLAANAPASRN